MTGNFIMVQKEDLEAIVTGIVEKILGGRKFEEPAELEEEYYTRDQACEHLHISTTKLWRLEKDGKVKVYKVGRRSLYSKKAIDELIKSNVAVAS